MPYIIRYTSTDGTKYTPAEGDWGLDMQSWWGGFMPSMNTYTYDTAEEALTHWKAIKKYRSFPVYATPKATVEVEVIEVEPEYKQVGWKVK